MRRALATLEFRIAPQAPDSAKIALKNQAAVVTVEGKEIRGVGGKSGEITVTKTPPAFVNCFFFTH